DVGSGRGLWPNSVTSSVAQPQITPGAEATCCASSPSDIDFGCGFHVSLSVGTRSSTRLVVLASFSNSARKACVTDIGPPLFSTASVSGTEDLILARRSPVGDSPRAPPPTVRQHGRRQSVAPSPIVRQHRRRQSVAPSPIIREHPRRKSLS